MRIIERVRAAVGGYWWKRCTCGRTFGGHERGWSLEKKHGYTDFWCPTCTAEHNVNPCMKSVPVDPLLRRTTALHICGEATAHDGEHVCPCSHRWAEQTTVDMRGSE